MQWNGCGVDAAACGAVSDVIFYHRMGKIVAQFDVKRGPKKGEVVLPSFDEYDCTLTAESCGAAAPDSKQAGENDTDYTDKQGKPRITRIRKMARFAQTGAREAH